MDGAAICINRTVTIEAQVPGSVVLNAGSKANRFREGGLRVVDIKSGGMARLIGLNITGGYASYYACGGLYIQEGGTAMLTDVNVYSNTASYDGGAGIYVDYGGEATLTNTNVFDNEAGAPMLHQGSSYFSVLCTLNLPTGSSSAALL